LPGLTLLGHRMRPSASARRARGAQIGFLYHRVRLAGPMAIVNPPT
jgi:hypothetical protein